MYKCISKVIENTYGVWEPQIQPFSTKAKAKAKGALARKRWQATAGDLAIRTGVLNHSETTVTMVVRLTRAVCPCSGWRSCRNLCSLFPAVHACAVLDVVAVVVGSRFWLLCPPGTRCNLHFSRANCPADTTFDINGDCGDICTVSECCPGEQFLPGDTGVKIGNTELCGSHLLVQ